MRFTNKVPAGFVRLPDAAAGDRATQYSSFTALGVPIVCVPAKRPAPFGFYAPAWAAELLNEGTLATTGIAAWKLRLVERASRLLPPEDRALVEEALVVRALCGDAGVLAWLAERG